MLIQPPQLQQNNPYQAALAANTAAGQNQTAAQQTQATRREDVVTLSPAGEQRQAQTQAAANTGAAANAVYEPPAPGGQTTQTPAQTGNTQAAGQQATQTVQQQTATQNPNTGPVTGLNVVG